MTLELVLLLGVYVFIVIGVFLGDMGPVATFKKSAPRLGARIERDITIGHGFSRLSSDGTGVNWVGPTEGTKDIGVD